MKKYDAQRKILKGFEKKLQYHPKTCIVYEDFAGRYKDGDGGKMMDLILTLVYWDEKKGMKIAHYYDTFSRGSLTEEEISNLDLRGKQDAFVYRDVWLRLLSKTKIFDNFDTIIKSGDNGGSLKCYQIFYFAGMIWDKFKKRVLWCTLCPHHAYNRCDPHGGIVMRELDRVEKAIQDYLGDAKEHSDIINSKQIKNTKADCVEVLREYDKFMPANLTGKDDQVYGIQNISVMFPEIPSIHARDSNRTVRYPGIAMVQLTADSNEVAFLDCREDGMDPKNVCGPCSRVFCRCVLKSEHNERNLYFCKVTNVGSTEEDLNRVCADCGETINDGHIQGTKYKCPVREYRLDENDRPKTFTVRTLFHGEKNRVNPDDPYLHEFPIKYESDGPLTAEQLININIMYYNVPQQHRSLARKADDTFKIIEGKTVVAFASNKSQISARIPWGLGRCVKVDSKERMYTIEIFPSKEKESVWSVTFDTDSKEKKEVKVSFNTPMYYPIRLHKTGEISTTQIFKIMGKLGWNPDTSAEQSVNPEELGEPEEPELKEMTGKKRVEKGEEGVKCING